ncbi:threonine/serine exporter family protein [Helicovermis profundi]|uniref:Threonine/serine exporter family protein n=1 Tax=Helicovermis profundi TaxID=3065157 RepID=A0AAU9ECU8_9FIRM|nr:threonine/serine exporter family protein [Clostridia bacterium S502]
MNFLFSFLSSVGFAGLFNIPRKELIFTGIVGGTGYIAYRYIDMISSTSMLGYFFGALIVGIFAEILAIIRKKPVTLYIIPGIIPLVPGYGLYYTMLKIIEKNYSGAAEVGFESFMVSLAIAAAIIIANGFGKHILRRKS